MDEQKLTNAELSKFKKGNNIYIISDRSSIHKKFMIDSNTEEELENVLMKKRELYPNMRLEFLIYTKYSLLIKDCLYIKYKETNILDWIHNVDLEDLIESIEQLFEFLNLELEPQ
jgi:hypothetical protein